MRGLLVGLLSAVLAGCSTLGGSGTGSGTTGSPVISRIVENGVLRVGMSGDQPPLNFKSRSGDMMGLDVDISRGLAAMMGVEPRFVQKPFGELLGALRTGEVDLVISGVTITPARNMKVPFVGPYHISGKSILTKSSTLAQADDTADLDQPTLRLAALAGSTSQDFVKAFLPRATLTTTPDYDAAIELLLDDKVHAVVADYEICVISALRRPEDGFVTLDRPLTVEPLGVAVATGDPLFLNLMENNMGALEASGLFEGLRGRWFKSGMWLEQLP
jgi:polar amino acid transport system substrate-binding protein